MAAAAPAMAADGMSEGLNRPASSAKRRAATMVTPATAAALETTMSRESGFASLSASLFVRTSWARPRRGSRMR